VPVRDGADHLRDCLASLSRLEYPRDRFEVLVVDNGSRDGSAAIAHEFGVRLVLEPASGAGNARNAGFRAATGQLVAFLDCDCRAATGWLGEIAETFADSEVAAVVGEVVSMPPRGPAERYAARRKPLWQEWTSQRRGAVHLGSANCALRRHAFAHVGGFDPRFQTAEDIDLSLRLIRAGFVIRPNARAVVFHRHRGAVLELARQHFRYGRGQALLTRLYVDEFPWDLRVEARAWLDLGSAVFLLVKGARRSGGAEYEALDFVRRLAQRLGFASGMLLADAARPSRPGG